MIVNLTYLGVAGWHFQTVAGSLLVDPYFTRLSMMKMLLGQAVPDRAVIDRFAPSAEWILVTHPHYDHIMDVPAIVESGGAVVYASVQANDLLAALGVAGDKRQVISPGDRITLGDFEVDVYASVHRTILGRIPCEGPLKSHLSPPLRALDYRIRQEFSFRVAAENCRVLVVSGIDNEPAVEADVVLIGADANVDQLARVLEPAAPGLVLPNHWDDMFRPLGKPVRPMHRPPRGVQFTQRLDMVVWAERVRAILPQAEVIVPERFAGMSL
ncbi:MAG: MBL fold metallo-hydrolase [Anaerolineae bacterium]|nr:MBL fold metallo-hydrolase [Anaerolineae bacterium]